MINFTSFKVLLLLLLALKQVVSQLEPQFENPIHQPEQRIAKPARTLPVPVLGQSSSSLYYQIVHGIKTQKGTQHPAAHTYAIE